MTNIEEIRKAALNADEQIKIILALTEQGVPGPVISEWIIPEPKPRADWMVIPTNFTKEIYVDPDGNDGNSGELQSPLQTLAAAVTMATPKTNIRLKRGGVWAKSARMRSKSGMGVDNPILISDYGEGALPVLGSGLYFEGNETNPIEGMYFQNLDIDGGGGWTVWDDCRYFMFDKINTRNTSLGFNISPGRTDDGYVNENFAWFNCRIEDNMNGGLFSGASNIFIDGCHLEGNGNGWSNRNLYLAGHGDLTTHDIILQRTTSKRNCPQPGGGAGNSPHYTTHGWVNGLYVIDNKFEEIINTSGGGCWGICPDSGRNPDWGEEKFSNVVIVGNTVKYCGNQCVSITNADNPLIGWNDIYIDPKNRGNGIAAPGKNYEAPDFVMTKGRFVYNKVHVPANGLGMRIDMPYAQLEYNEIIKLDPTAKGIVVNGAELQGDALGTNVYKAA